MKHFQMIYRRRNIPNEWRTGSKSRTKENAIDRCFQFVVRARHDYECKVLDTRTSEVVWQSVTPFSGDQQEMMQ